MDIDIARHDIERSHRIGQSRQHGDKPRPKKYKGKKVSINESLTTSRVEKLKEAQELCGFRNV